MRILLVEDSDDDATLVRMAFEKHADVDRVETLAVATAKIGVEKYDAVILDLLRPDGVGPIEVARLKESSHIAVIVLTGSAPLLTESIQAGADDAIHKDDIANGRFVASVMQTIAKHVEAMQEREKRKSLEKKVDELGDTIVEKKLDTNEPGER